MLDANLEKERVNEKDSITPEKPIKVLNTEFQNFVSLFQTLEAYEEFKRFENGKDHCEWCAFVPITNELSEAGSESWVCPCQVNLIFSEEAMTESLSGLQVSTGSRNDMGVEVKPEMCFGQSSSSREQCSVLQIKDITSKQEINQNGYQSLTSIGMSKVARLGLSLLRLRKITLNTNNSSLNVKNDLDSVNKQMNQISPKVKRSPILGSLDKISRNSSAEIEYHEESKQFVKMSLDDIHFYQMDQLLQLKKLKSDSINDVKEGGVKCDSSHQQSSANECDPCNSHSSLVVRKFTPRDRNSLLCRPALGSNNNYIEIKCGPINPDSEKNKQVLSAQKNEDKEACNSKRSPPFCHQSRTPRNLSSLVSQESRHFVHCVTASSSSRSYQSGFKDIYDGFKISEHRFHSKPSASFTGTYRSGTRFSTCTHSMHQQNNDVNLSSFSLYSYPQTYQSSKLNTLYNKDVSFNHGNRSNNAYTSQSSSSSSTSSASMSNGNRDETTRNLDLSGARIVHVLGDGRCLFRSLVTCMHTSLQNVGRTEFGLPECDDCAYIEEKDADKLRDQVVRFMKSNLLFYSELGTELINADQPSENRYKKFLDRINHMSVSSTMAGELELNAASHVLQQMIVVVDANLSVIYLFGQESYPESEPLVVRYTKLLDDVGHFDAVLPQRNSSHNNKDEKNKEDQEICQSIAGKSVISDKENIEAVSSMGELDICNHNNKKAEAPEIYDKRLRKQVNSTKKLTSIIHRKRRTRRTALRRRVIWADYKAEGNFISVKKIIKVNRFRMKQKSHPVKKYPQKRKRAGTKRKRSRSSGFASSKRKKRGAKTKNTKAPAAKKIKSKIDSQTSTNDSVSASERPRCFVCCEPVWDNATHHVMTCFMCQRQAHWQCATTDSPYWTDIPTEDNSFLCHCCAHADIMN